MDQFTAGLPPAAQERIERQRASGATGSLLSAAAAASVQSAGLKPVGEVFGCLVMQLGWAGGGCSWWNSGAAGSFGGLGSMMGGGLGGWGAISPVTTSGTDSSRYSGFAPYVKAYESAWYGALRRMLAEARALGAHGVVGVQIGRTRIEGSIWEFTAVGTAVCSVDPSAVPFPASESDVWNTNLTAEDCASAILSGFLPTEIVMAMSVSTKHEDMQVQQQRSSWINGEVSGMTDLIQAARHESRTRLSTRARHSGSAELVVTGMELLEFETQCGQDGKDLHAESVVTGTTLVPIPRFRPSKPTVLTVIPLTDIVRRRRP